MPAPVRSLSSQEDAEKVLGMSMELYKLAEDFRYQGEFVESHRYIVYCIKMANVALDMAREKMFCRNLIAFLSAAVAFSDGLDRNRR